MIAKNLQDKYLSELVSNNKIVEINLINGLILTCKIEKFDNFCLQIKD